MSEEHVHLVRLELARHAIEKHTQKRFDASLNSSCL